jgi:hypothetical protein
LWQEKLAHEKATEKDKQNRSAEGYAASQAAASAFTGEQGRAEV